MSRFFWYSMFLAVSLSNVQQAAAQQQNDEMNSKYSLTPFMLLLRLEAFKRSQWELFHVYEKDEMRPRSTQEVLSGFAKVTSTNTKNDTAVANKSSLIARYKNEATQLFEHLKVINGQAGMFICDSSTVPLEFVIHNHNLTALLTGVSSNVIYNILIVTAKERALKTINSLGLPALEYFYEYFQHTPVVNLGIMLFYGSNDFSSSSDRLDKKGEAVVIITNKALLGKFIAGEITDHDLLKSSDIFLSDRENVAGIRKVDLVSQ